MDENKCPECGGNGISNWGKCITCNGKAASQSKPSFWNESDKIVEIKVSPNMTTRIIKTDDTQLSVEIVDWDGLPEVYKKMVYQHRKDDGNSYMLISHNNEEPEVETDGMEPEDVRFCRDLSWIKPAIEQAYKWGLADSLFRNQQAIKDAEIEFVESLSEDELVKLYCSKNGWEYGDNEDYDIAVETVKWFLDNIRKMVDEGHK